MAAVIADSYHSPASSEYQLLLHQQLHFAMLVKLASFIQVPTFTISKLCLSTSRLPPQEPGDGRGVPVQSIPPYYRYLCTGDYFSFILDSRWVGRFKW